MLNRKYARKGVVLFIVLGTLLVVVSLTTVVLSLITSNAKLTNHEISRIRAYYAAFAGMNLARENIRLSTVGWVPAAGSVTRTLCSSGCDVNDTDIPYPVAITIWGPNTSIDGIGRKITIAATY
jgi:Tfp pilus assembly protein PilX